MSRTLSIFRSYGNEINISSTTSIYLQNRAFLNEKYNRAPEENYNYL